MLNEYSCYSLYFAWWQAFGGLASRPKEVCEMHTKACHQAKYRLLKGNTNIQSLHTMDRNVSRHKMCRNIMHEKCRDLS